MGRPKILTAARTTSVQLESPLFDLVSRWQKHHNCSMGAAIRLMIASCPIVPGKRSAQDEYRAAIVALDHELGHLVDKLDRCKDARECIRIGLEINCFEHAREYLVHHSM